MPAMFIILIPSLTILQTGFALECLQCSGISQPRHCRIVSTCDADEICGVQQVTTLHGRNIYNVGCVSKQHCLGSNTNHGDGCLTCCDSNLCNAAGCGEPGYPANIGPVCYNCPFHTHPDTCNAIEVCEPGMVCKYDFMKDFGDLVYSGQCAEKHTCSPDTVNINTLVGRRTLIEHVCNGCCDTDLCNKQCDALISQDNMSDCLDLYRMNPSLPDGIYNIRLWKSKTVMSVYCVMSMARGGWTVFQNRFDGSVDFYRDLSNYTEGFGNVSGEYWLGLRYIKELADQGTSTIRMEGTLANGTSLYEEWPDFSLENAPGFRLHVGGNGTGTAGDKSNYFTINSNNMPFTAKGSACGNSATGGWWYKSCSWINLNGKFNTSGFTFDYVTPLKASIMMLRRK